MRVKNEATQKQVNNKDFSTKDYQDVKIALLSEDDIGTLVSFS